MVSRLSHTNPAKIIVLIPTLNEAAHIDRVVRRLVREDRVASVCPVVIADGGSDDGTQEIVQSLAADFNNVRLVHNPGRSQAAAMNMLLGADYADAQIAIRCDAHAYYPKGFVSALVQQLEDRPDAASVVIPMDAVAETGCFQKGLALISDTKLGAGGSPHRGGQSSGYVDHGHHAAFRLNVFRQLGGYDTAFRANEDAEYDRRLTNAGHRIWLEGGIRIGYVPRASIWRLWRQYMAYGVGRAQTCRKHQIQPALRQLIPVVHTVLLAVSLALMPFTALGLVWPLIYGAVIVTAGLWTAWQHQTFCGLAAIPALATMHTAWGLGFLRGMLAGRLGTPTLQHGPATR